MSFRNDYFRRLLERIEESDEQRAEEGQRGRAPDSIARLDAELVERYRERPDALRTALDDDALDPSQDFETWDDLFSLRTGLLVELEGSNLPEETVLLLARSLLVGVDRMLERSSRLPPLPGLLADVLRQERLVHALSPLEIAEAWRVLFEFELDRDQFANAEDALFHAIELADDPKPLIRRGLDVYDGLLDLPGERLERGGLPRAEAEEARWELLERLDGLL